MEPEIIINGTKLTEGQAMTVRVALEAFASSLKNDKIDAGYRKVIGQIRDAMGCFIAAESKEA